MPIKLVLIIIKIIICLYVYYRLIIVIVFVIILYVHYYLIIVILFRIVINYAWNLMDKLVSLEYRLKGKPYVVPLEKPTVGLPLGPVHKLLPWLVLPLPLPVQL